MSSRQRKIVSDGETPAGGHFAIVGDETVLARQRSGIDGLGGIFDIKVPLTSRQFCFTVASILLLGFALRLPTLTRSLWLDETCSAWFSSLPLHELWSEAPLYENHPPFYYALLKGWSIAFGTSEIGLRSFSVLASLATILVIALAGRVLRAETLGDKVALLAAFFLAINEGNIDYAQQARPYALETLTASIAILSALLLIRRIADQSHGLNGGIRNRLPGMVMLAIGAGLTLWLHNTAIVIAFGIWLGLAVSLFCFVRGNRWHQLLVLVLPGIGALLIWSPFLPMFVHQGTTFAGNPFWITFNPSEDLLGAWYLVAGGNQPLFFVTTFALIGLAALWRVEKAMALFLTCVLFLPWATILALSYFVKPVFIDRLFEWMAPTVLCLAALGILAGLRHPLARVAATLAVAFFCLATTRQYYATPTEDWRGMIQSIFADMQPGDLIIGGSSEISIPVAYYAKDMLTSSDVLFVPSPFPAMNAARTEFIGTPKVVPDDMKRVDEALKGRSRVWLIERRSDLYDPDGLVIAAISASRKPVRSTQQTGIRVTLFQ